MEKENPHDFRVGDMVFDCINGSPNNPKPIDSINFGKKYPIKVDGDENYTMDGKWHSSDKERRLYHAGTKITIEEHKPVRSKWVNIYFNPGTYQIEIGCVSDSKEDAVTCGVPAISGIKYFKTIELTKED